jgi:hypothetical protein
MLAAMMVTVVLTAATVTILNVNSDCGYSSPFTAAAKLNIMVMAAIMVTLVVTAMRRS